MKSYGEHSDQHALPWFDEFHHKSRHNSTHQDTKKMEKLRCSDKDISTAVQVELRDDLQIFWLQINLEKLVFKRGIIFFDKN